MNRKLEKLEKFIIIIDEENSILGKLIKDNFLYFLRRRYSEYGVYYMSIEDSQDFIEKYHLKEFPSILFFKDLKLIKQTSGFSYLEQKAKKLS